MQKPLPVTTVVVLACMLCLILWLITGCSDAYNDCLEQQKIEYRSRNPGASYGQLQAQAHNFELMCSRFRPR